VLCVDCKAKNLPALAGAWHAIGRSPVVRDSPEGDVPAAVKRTVKQVQRVAGAPPSACSAVWASAPCGSAQLALPTGATANMANSINAERMVAA
jgi:hypothetical protein